MAFRAHVPFALEKSGGGERLLADAVDVQEFKRGAGFEDVGVAVVSGEEDLAIDADGGGGEAMLDGLAAAFLPEERAFFGVEAGDDAGDVVDHVEMVAIKKRAGD